MKRLLLPIAFLVSFNASSQELAIEVLSIVNADTVNISFMHEELFFLPDGSGESYESSILIEGFDSSAIIMTSSDLYAFGMIIEHSYLGDLDISLKCPNDQEMFLKSYPGGGGTFLGEPNDVDNDLDPGIGYYYLFKEDASYLDLTSESANFTTLPEGSYLWENGPDELSGCPLNGDWTLKITDNLGSDNGYIFNWQLFFDPLIVPDSLNNGSIILEIVDGSPPGLVQTEWYVEWSNGQTGLVNEHLAPGEYVAWLREVGTNAFLDSVHVTVGIGADATSINEYDNELLSVYPNPVERELTIAWKMEQADYEILNSSGMLIQKGKLAFGVNRINANDLASGLYFIQVKSSDKNIVKRFVKK